MRSSSVFKLKCSAAIDVFVFPHIGCFSKEKESATSTSDKRPCFMIDVHIGNNVVRRIYHLLKERLGTRIMMKKHVERLTCKRGRHGCTICTDVLFQIFRHDWNEILSSGISEPVIQGRTWQITPIRIHCWTGRSCHHNSRWNKAQTFIASRIDTRFASKSIFLKEVICK